MKISIYLFVFFSLCFHSTVYSQYSCQTAIKDQMFFQVPLPPIGTIAPAGPDYGCLTLFTRPFFGYFISCDSTGFGPVFQLDQITVPVEISFIMWGPFTDRNFSCNNLTAANIFMCEDRIPNSGWFLDSLSAFSALPGEFYYYMLTTTDSTVNNTYTTLHGITQPGVGNPYPCYDCNGQVSMLYKRDICLVTFDSASQKTKVIWEKVFDGGIDGYIIHRGIQGSSQVDSAGYVSETLPGEFIDYDSHPFQYGENYSIQPVDSCGQKHNVFDYVRHNACFLQATPAGNNTVNLNWSLFIAWQYLYEPVQYIYRGSSPQTMQIIDTIPYGINIYTDITAPPGQQYYSVERRRYSACNPLRISSATQYHSAMSNYSGATVTGLPVLNDDRYFQVFPVPANGILNIKIPEGMAGSKLSIVDIQGKAVYNDFISGSTETVDVSNLPSGTYWLCITGTVRWVKKIEIS